MASVNTINWIKKNIKYVGQITLEVGSKRYKEHSFLFLREILTEQLPELTMIGSDISAGDNVDLVLDITAPLHVVQSSVDNRIFDSIFCISVLEHIPNIFNACRNISYLLKPGGALFISVPFVFRYHGYPGDFWRFTPEAINYLFPDINFADYQHSFVSTLEQDDTMSLKNNNIEKINRFLFRPKSREEKLIRKEAKHAGSVVEPYYLAPAMINMLGFKR